jgi:hypothetical protein
VRESGGPAEFDPANWVAHWLHRAQPALGGQRLGDLMGTGDGTAPMAFLAKAQRVSAEAGTGRGPLSSLTRPRSRYPVSRRLCISRVAVRYRSIGTWCESRSFGSLEKAQCLGPGRSGGVGRATGRTRVDGLGHCLGGIKEEPDC